MFEERVFGAECTPIYGGGEVCPKVAVALIDKAVLKAGTNYYVDNLIESDPRYLPEDIVVFRLTIKNTGQVTIKEVVVKDIFPKYISFHSGIGRYENGVVTIDVDDLADGERKEFFIRAAVVKQQNLPADKSLLCTVNRVQMQGKVDGDIFVSDASQLCIEKKVLGKGAVAEALPAAGAGSLVFIASALATAGFLIRKKAG